MELDVLRQRESTEAGSYFIANYPPFSAWSAEHLPAVQRVLDTPADAAHGAGGLGAAAVPLGLYLHIPFCRKRCKFCYFRVYTDKNAADVDEYMEALAREIAIHAGKPRFAGRQFEFVYFGGGTPSFLSSAQLQRLIERINQHWRWDAAREVTFECEPGTLKESKLRTIRQIGVTRLSLGIEHWDDAILEQNGRAHRSKEIVAAYGWARDVGFPQINVDLIAGMVGDDDAKWQRAVERTLALQPDSVTIYQMELPFNTIFTREMRESGASPVADWATKRRWVASAFEQFESAGYRVSSGYTLARAASQLPASPDSARGIATEQNGNVNAGFVYRDSLWHGADLVGAGVASFSHVGGVHFQNQDRWENYLTAVRRGELPLSRALAITPRQALIRELVLQTKLGRLDTAYFSRKFAVSILEEFSEVFAALREQGLVRFDRDRIELTREGLLRVDALLPAFFEPQYRGVRYT